MTIELGIRNEELGKPPAHPRLAQGEVGREFLIPDFYFIIGWPGGWK